MLHEMDTKDLHYLCKSKDVQSMMIMVEMFLRASLMRTESRASHYRVDYPDRDNENWLKWIVFNLEKGELGCRTEPLPVHKYKFKDWEYYSDNFKFPAVTL